MIRRLYITAVLLAAAPLAIVAASRQDPLMVTVSGTVSVASSGTRTQDRANVVVWLKPVREVGTVMPPGGVTRPRIVQRDRRFEPHLLVVSVGSAVEFPNRDPFFHNVFSLYDGKRFDLGLYEAGTTRSVTFSRPGVSYIFCNIHPEMSAVVMALDTPYYGVSDRSGDVTIRDVPAGRYRLFVWHERLQPSADYPRDIAIASTNPSLGVLSFAESGQLIAPHTNKYGQEYNPPRPSSPIYKKPQSHDPE